MTLTVDGVEYTEVDPGVWEPVATTSGTSNPATGAQLHRATSRPVRLLQGDTPAPLVLAARDLSGTLLSMDSGWTCRSQVLDANRAVVIAERDVTETTTAGDVTAFVARLTEAESLQLVPTLPGPPTTFYWSVEVADADRRLVRTTEVRLAVTGLPA